MSQRKLIQAFRTFFQKSVAPIVQQNDQIMREWNHLSKILSSDPIDYGQIEFYLLLSNKNSAPSQPMPMRGSQHTIGSMNKIPDVDNKFYGNDYGSNNEKSSPEKGNFQKRGSFMTGSISKKKNLLNNLQNFQKLLVSNQQRLEALCKKQNTQTPQIGVNNGVPAPSYRRY